MPSEAHANDGTGQLVDKQTCGT